MSQNEIKMMYDVLIADIEVGERKRAINSEKVTALMQSIKAIGLQMPITLYGWPDDQKPCTLVAGFHRLEAVKRLGRDAIPAFITKANEIDREIWEIDENLMRAELTEIERGEHLKRRKEIFDARSSAEKILTTPSKRGRIGEGHPKGFDQDTAEKTGMEKSTVRKSRSRAEKITPEVKEAIKDMPAADSGVELDAIASLEPDEQMQAVERVKSGASKDFREAKDFIKGEEPTAVDAEYMRQEKSLRRLGPMVKTPEGKTVEQVCREGMAMEAGGMKIAEVAKDLGMSAVTYRSARDIIRLADKRELSKRDKATVTVALSEMNGLNQVAMPHEAVMPIVERVWGKGSKRKSEKSRLRTFDQAYGILSQWLMLASEIEVPYLSSERVTEILAELKKGQKCLRKFEQKISEIHR